MLDILNILDANIDIPLGTGFEKQTVSSEDKITSVEISFEDNAAISESFDKQYTYVTQYEIADNIQTVEEFNMTAGGVTSVNIEDNILIVDTFNKEYTYVVNKSVNDGISISESFELTNNANLQAVDSVKVTESYDSSYSYNISQTFADDIAISETFDIKHFVVKQSEDNLLVTEQFDLSSKAVLYIQDGVTISEQFFMQELSPVGELVFTNTVKNKYIEEPFVDKNVTEGKTYKYIVKTYNDFQKYSNPNEIQVAVQNAGDITPPANATISVSYQDGFININVADPDDSDWESTTLRYDVNSNVGDKFSGTKLFDNNVKDKYKVNPFKLAAIVGKTYYFKAFTKDLYGNVNETMQSVSVTTYIPGGVTPTAPVSDLKAVLNSDNTTVNITWSDPDDSNWTSTVVVMKQGSMPTAINDGSAFLNTVKNKYKTAPLVFNTPIENATYYFKAFPKNNYVYNMDSAGVNVTTLDLTPPANVDGFKVAYEDYTVKIALNNSNADIKGIKVVRFDDAVGDVKNGIEIADVVDLNGEYKFVDETINYNRTYVYKCYPYDKYNNVNTNDAQYSIYTKDERISDVSDLKVEIVDEDVVFTYTNPSNDYFLESNLYVDYSRIYNNGQTRKSLNTSNVRGYIKTSIKISDLKKYVPSNAARFYFLVVAKNYEGKEIYNTQYNVDMVIKDTVPPVDIQNMSVYVEDGYANITWDESVSTDWVKSIVMVKEGSEPESTSSNDGEQIKTVLIKNQHQTIPLTYKLAKQNVLYYFKVFPIDDSGNINYTCIPASCTLDVPSFNEEVTDLMLQPDNRNIIVTCNDPEDEKWRATKVVRNELHIPTSHDDGEIVFVNTIRDQYVTNGYIDRNLQPRKTYYYAAFCRDENEIYSTKVAKASIFLQDETAPTEVNDLKITVLEEGIELTWSDADDIDWEGCKLVKKRGSEPTDHGDGELLINNNIKNRFQNDGLVDTQIVEEETYYYRVFTYDNYGNYSKGNTVEYKADDVTPTAPAKIRKIEQVPHPTDIVLKFLLEDPKDADWAKTTIYYDVYGGDFSNKIELFTNTVKNKYYSTYLEIVCNDIVPNQTYQFKPYAYDLSGNVNEECVPFILNVVENVDIGNSNIINLTYEDGKITFNIDDDELKDFSGCDVIRKTGGEPLSIADRDKFAVQYTAADTYKTARVIDNAIADYTTYYYKAFPYKTLSNGEKFYNTNCKSASITTEVTTPPVTAPITAKFINGAINLTWTIPEDSTFAECYIVKKVGSMPTSETDGTLLVHNIGGYRVTNYNDTDIVDNTTYYYRSFTVDKYGNWNRTYIGTSIKISSLNPTSAITGLRIYQAWNSDGYGYVDGTTTALTCNAIGTDGDNFKKVELLAKKDGVPNASDGYLIKRNQTQNRIIERIDTNNLSGVSFYDSYRNMDWYFKAITYDKLNNTYESEVLKFTAYTDKNTAYSDKYVKSIYDYMVGSTSIDYIQQSFSDSDDLTSPNKIKFRYYAENKNSSNVLPTFKFRYSYYDYLPILTGEIGVNDVFGKSNVSNEVKHQEVRKTFDPAVEKSKECFVELPATPTAAQIPLPGDHWTNVRNMLNVVTVSAAFTDSQYDPSNFEFALDTFPIVRKMYYYPNMFRVDKDYIVLINAEMASYGQGTMNYNTVITFKRGSMPKNADDGTKVYHAGYQYGGTNTTYYDADATLRLRSFINNGKSTSFLNPCTVLKIPSTDYSSTDKLYFKAFFVKDNAPNKGTYSNSYGEVTLS